MEINTKSGSALPPLVPPLLNELSLNFPAGNTVVVTTRGIGTFRGQVFQNPSTTGIANSITLIRVIDEETGNEGPGHITLYQSDIISVSVIEAPTKKIEPSETVMDTYVITTVEELRNLLDILKKEVEIGCYIPGALSDAPSYVLFNVKDAFIVIHASSFVGQDQKLLWECMGQGIFANAKLIKVFWDCRAIRSYLYHHHNLPLTNAFDLRIMELCVTNKTPPSPCSVVLTENKLNIQLADLLKKYLPSRVPICDLKVLSKPLTTVCNNHLSLSLMQQSSKKYCVLKVKYLLLLKAALLMEFFEPWKVVTESEGRIVLTH